MPAIPKNGAPLKKYLVRGKGRNSAILVVEMDYTVVSNIIFKQRKCGVGQHLVGVDVRQSYKRKCIFLAVGFFTIYRHSKSH